MLDGARPARPRADRGAARGDALDRRTPSSVGDVPRAGRDGAGADAVDDRVAGSRPTTVSDIIFTSGTTGKPKGVMCTHGQTLRDACAPGPTSSASRAGDRYLIVNPFFHTFGYKAGILACAHDRRHDRPAAGLRRARGDGARSPPSGSRCSPGRPTLYQTILDHPDLDQLDSSSLRLAVTGAASVPVELIERMRDELGFETIITAYGLTEATGIATMCRRDDDAETIATTSGRAIPGIEVRVVDDDGTEVPRGEPGEVVVRGYNVMPGYFEDPDADRRGDRRRRLAAHRRHRRDGRARLPQDHRPQEGHVHRRRVQRLPGRDREPAARAPRHRPGRGGRRARRAHGRGRRAPSSCAATGTDARRRARSSPGPRSTWPTTRCRATVEIVDALPLNAGGKVLKFELRDRRASARSTEEGTA